MGDEIKVFNITGEAAKAYSGGKKKRTTRKKGDESSVVPGPVVLGPVVPAMKSADPVPIIHITQQHHRPAPPTPPVVSVDDKKIKVELKKKQATKKVQLHPKKEEKTPVPKKTETRKKNRKILLGVSSLHKRMTRAKKMQTTVKEMPLDKLKEELVKKKLIKVTSKAPESVLRQIAVDAQIVEGKAL
jgi:hypothetical protein